MSKLVRQQGEMSKHRDQMVNFSGASLATGNTTVPYVISLIVTRFPPLAKEPASRRDGLSRLLFGRGEGWVQLIGGNNQSTQVRIPTPHNAKSVLPACR